MRTLHEYYFYIFFKLFAKIFLQTHSLSLVSRIKSIVGGIAIFNYMLVFGLLRRFLAASPSTVEIVLWIVIILADIFWANRRLENGRHEDVILRLNSVRKRYGLLPFILTFLITPILLLILIIPFSTIAY